MGKNGFREKLEKALEMPIELLNNYPRITVLGKDSIFIENYKAITEYEENLIRISNNVSIYGKKLNVEEITADDMLISGEVKTIEFE
jgi:sporulation protein YqfC